MLIRQKNRALPANWRACGSSRIFPYSQRNKKRIARISKVTSSAITLQLSAM
jgi:hypothetical protein